VQIYNLMNVTPRESVVVKIAAAEVPAAYQALQDVVSKVKGRVLTARLDETDRQNIRGQFEFDVRRGDEAAVQDAMAAAGEGLSRNVNRTSEADNVTDSKVRFQITIVSAATLVPRETTTVQVAAPDVLAAYRALQDAVSKAKGRVVTAKLDETDR